MRSWVTLKESFCSLTTRGMPPGWRVVLVMSHQEEASRKTKDLLQGPGRLANLGTVTDPSGGGDWDLESLGVSSDTVVGG